MSYNEFFDIENAIEETMSQLEQQYIGIEVIKNHARDIFTSASLIVALLSVLGLGNASYNFYKPGAREILLMLAGSSYIIIVFLNVWLLTPVSMSTAMKAEWKVFEKLYFGQPPKRILENKLENYIKAVEENAPILKRKKSVSNVINYVYAAVVLSLLMALFI